MPDSSHEEHQIEVAGLPIQLRRGGSGSTLLVVHHETGNPGWMPFHDALAQSHDVLLPTLPGWDGTQRGEWMRNPRDLASVLQLLLDELAVERCAIVGLGFGGFLAAEMAVANQARIDGLVLVGAMGLQVEDAEIRDQFLEGHEDYVQSCFHDVANFHALFGETPSTEQLVAWDANREMTARTAQTAWKPFLYSQSLPHLLSSVRCLRWWCIRSTTRSSRWVARRPTRSGSATPGSKRWRMPDTSLKPNRPTRWRAQSPRSSPDPLMRASGVRIRRPVVGLLLAVVCVGLSASFATARPTVPASTLTGSSRHPSSPTSRAVGIRLPAND